MENKIKNKLKLYQILVSDRRTNRLKIYEYINADECLKAMKIIADKYDETYIRINIAFI